MFLIKQFLLLLFASLGDTDLLQNIPTKTLITRTLSTPVFNNNTNSLVNKVGKKDKEI